MLAQVTTFAIDGIDARRVTVEVDLRQGLPAFTIVGLGDKAVREARERVHAAIVNSGFQFPQRRITANLAPAHLRKTGPGFDLALACGILAAGGQLPGERLERWALHAELGLDGRLRPSRGTLVVAEGALRCGLRGLLVAPESGGEAALADDLEVAAPACLRDAVAALAGDEEFPPGASAPTTVAPGGGLDLVDVRGHEAAVRGLTVAAAGGHNVLLSGPPGVGKTMLARRLPSILPPLSRREALEVTRIHSVAGLLPAGGLVGERPFRAPHHSISASGLVGGGAVPTPGEATLAQHGVLFLDELSEFSRSALEALRQPLEDGRVTVVRGQHTAVYPSAFMLVAATNPCPCGFAGDDRCRCTEADLARHRRRLSGPLLDRVDLLLPLPRPGGGALGGAAPTRSAEVRDRVVVARERQVRRAEATGAACNARLSAAALQRAAPLTDRAEALLREAYDRHRLSARAQARALRVAWTVADLAGSDRIGRGHVAEALAYRQHEDADAQAA